MLSAKILEMLRKRKSVKSTSASREIRYDDRDICHTEREYTAGIKDKKTRRNGVT